MGNVAAIDIGSNSVRLLITSETGAQLEREMNITRLAQDVDRVGRLVPEAMERTLDVLSGYGQLLKTHAVAKTRVTATSAARDASNREEFFAAVEQRVGAAPELLSGHDEASLAFAGAVGSTAAEGPCVTLDIGGGSTEIARGVDSVQACHSVNMGCVRVTERFLKTDPPSRDELAAARTFIQHQLQELKQKVPRAGEGQWIGLAGTVTSLAAWDAGLTRYSPEVTHGYLLKASRVRDMLERLSAASIAERKQWLLEPQRAGVIVGGALILDAALQHFGVEQLRVSEKDILDGLAASLR